MNVSIGAVAAKAVSASDNLRPKTGRFPKGEITPDMRLRMDTLADVVAEGARSITAAALALGWPQSTADRTWQMIRRELGAQAS